MRIENADREKVKSIGELAADVIAAIPEPSFFPINGYGPLARVLEDAYEQAASGKGRERHARDRPFLDQPIVTIGRMLSSVADGELYQAIKKSQEASGMISRGELDAAERELLGGINYLAAAILLIREERQKDKNE